MRPRVQDGYSDAVTQGHTPPPSSHGSYKPIDEYLNALRGHADVEIRLVSPLPTGPPDLLPPAGSPLNGGHVASSGCDKYKCKYKCVCVSVRARVCVSKDKSIMVMLITEHQFKPGRHFTTFLHTCICNGS